jgi:hypothetical protein
VNFRKLALAMPPSFLIYRIDFKGNITICDWGEYTFAGNFVQLQEKNLLMKESMK